MNVADTQELVHELQVHQIELQMQNDELQKAHQDVEISREKYYDLYNRAPVGYLTLDRDGRILEGNLVAAQMLGCPTSELKDRKFSSFVKPQSQDTYFTHYRSAFMTGIPRTCEVELIGKVPRHVQLNSLVFSGNGGCRTSISDVTAAKKLEEDLLRINEEEKTANTSQSEFLANMSHEIRTPMNVVVGIASILAKTKPLTPEQKKLIHTLQKSADILVSLTSDLLNISKIESGKFELEEVPFSIPAFVSEMVDVFEIQARDKKLGFMFRNDCKIENVIGDVGRLRQIVMNLCQNAIKYTHSGNIAITIRDTESRKNSCRNIVITIEDTGIGIPPQRIHSVFDKFIRGESSVSRNFEGTGLGLAIVKGLTEKMGGTVQVESEVGVGSVFTVEMPFRINAGQLSSDDTPDKTAKESTQSVDKLPVLLVEDHEPNILVATSILKELGYEYDIAIDGLSALKKFSENEHSVIIMDLQMPDMDGFEATKRIRAIEKNKNLEATPILAVTGNATEDDKFLCLKAGMNDFLAKPFRLNDLRKKLDLLQQKKAA